MTEELSQALTLAKETGAVDIVQTLSTVDKCFSNLERSYDYNDIVQAQNKIAGLIYLLTYAMQLALAKGLNKEEIRAALPNVYRIHSQSSFIRHLHTWPLGYPGDFCAINMIMDRREESPEQSLGGIIGRYALNTLIAQQHREKVAIQTNMVRDICRKVKDPRILSMACGSSRDLESIKYELAQSRAHIVLMDFDKRALDESRNRLIEIEDQIQLLLVNLRRLPKALSSIGKFQLIYAGGLFDYFSDGIIKIVLTGLAKHLSASNGVLMFTNIANNALFSSFKPWLEIIGNWQLIARSEDQMKKLLSAVNCKHYSLDLDPTGLAWIAKVYF